MATFNLQAAQPTKHKAKETFGYVKPNRKNIDTERKLSKIATQGGTYIQPYNYVYMYYNGFITMETFLSVVQLFNAVNKHQQSLTEKVKKAGPLESKRVKGMYVCIIHTVQWTTLANLANC